MRKTKLISIFLLALLVCSIVGFAISRRSAEQLSFRGIVMATNRESKPLILQGANGIALRHMGDERNRREAEFIFQTPPELRQATNQYSFVIENTSSKKIIALSLAYSFPKPDENTPEIGTLRTDALQGRLMGKSDSFLMLPNSKAGYCLALGMENFDFKNGTRVIQPERPTQLQMTMEQRTKMNEAILTRFAGFDRLLKEAVRFEVEIEGAIFDDGTFVGTNRRNCFEQNNAKLAGARSLADELLGLKDKGATHADLLAQAKTHIVDWKELLKPFGGLLSEAAQNESYLYQFSKSTVAHRFAGLAEADSINYLRFGQQHWKPLKRLAN